MSRLVRSILKATGLTSRHRSAVAALDERVTFNADGLATIHNSAFLDEPRFQEAYAAGVATPHRFGSHLHMEWRVRVSIWAAQVGLGIPGDFVECGVNSGITSLTIMKYLDFDRYSDKKFYLLDTYAGVPPGDLPEEQRLRQNKSYPDIYEQVVNVFSEFTNAVVVRGRIPETLTKIESDRICYLAIDLNCAAPELAAGEQLWNRLSPGAVIVLDDYGWPNHDEQKQTWDAFAEEHGVPLLPLPTGQGVIIKSREVSSAAA